MNHSEKAATLAEKLFPGQYQGALRAAFVELVALALKETRDAALEEALAAVSAEEPACYIATSYDTGYRRAIWDCQSVIRALK